MNMPGKVKISFRGVEDVDTTVVSQHYQGGGHKLASSCIISDEVFRTWRC